MAAAIKALNAKIRSNKYTDYICSTRTPPTPTTATAATNAPQRHDTSCASHCSALRMLIRCDCVQTFGAQYPTLVSPLLRYWTLLARTLKCMRRPETKTGWSRQSGETDETLVRHRISGKMTTALIVYSAVFMRYSMAVTPANYLLFGSYSIPSQLRRSRERISDDRSKYRMPPRQRECAVGSRLPLHPVLAVRSPPTPTTYHVRSKCIPHSRLLALLARSLDVYPALHEKL